MLKRINAYLSSQDKFIGKTVIKSSLVLFLSVIFSLQQFSTLAHVFTGNNESGEHAPIIHSEPDPVSPHISGSLPFSGQTGRPDAETTEEEELKNIYPKYFIASENKKSSDEFFYTAGIQSRLHQIMSSCRLKPPVPFFVLYHSWKSFLA